MMAHNTLTLLHSTPFGETVKREGLVPDREPPFSALYELAKRAAYLEAETRLKEAIKDGRAYEGAEPWVDPIRLERISKLFLPTNDRPIYLERADLGDLGDILSDRIGYPHTVAGLGERGNFALASAHLARDIFAGAGDPDSAIRVDSIILDRLGSLGIDIERAKTELPVSIFATTESALSEHSIAHTDQKSINRSEVTVSSPIPSDLLEEVSSILVPSTHTDLGRYLNGQDSRTYEVAGLYLR